MRYLRIGVCVLALVLMFGCATSINKVSENYAESSAAVRTFAEVTSADWLIGSGMLQGALPLDALPQWFGEELQKVDAWAEQGEFTDWQLGYMIGLRLRMAGPVVKGAIEMYAPALIGVREVALVLSFLGL